MRISLCIYEDKSWFCLTGNSIKQTSFSFEAHQLCFILRFHLGDSSTKGGISLRLNIFGISKSLCFLLNLEGFLSVSSLEGGASSSPYWTLSFPLSLPMTLKVSKSALWGYFLLLLFGIVPFLIHWCGIYLIFKEKTCRFTRAKSILAQPHIYSSKLVPLCLRKDLGDNRRFWFSSLKRSDRVQRIS